MDEEVKEKETKTEEKIKHLKKQKMFLKKVKKKEKKKKKI